MTDDLGGMVSPPGPRDCVWVTYLPTALVLLASLIVVGTSYVHFQNVAPHLWTNPIHDRNAHFWLSQSVGMDLRRGDLVNVVRDVEKTRVWGPLYPVVTGTVLAVGGLDYRVAVLPALASWFATAFLAFLIARRLVHQGGNLAGAFAALLVLASPAHQAFANDIMLEAPGACLSLLAVYLAIVFSQEQTPTAAKRLALSLTALFFLKYNYWLLMLFALTLAEVIARTASYRTFAVNLGAGVRQRWDTKSEMRNPINWILALAVVALCWRLLVGPSTYNLFGRRIRFHSADNPLWAFCALIFLRLFIWWRREGRVIIGRLDASARAFIRWHLYPVLLWFLMPKRLGNFLEYLTRNHGEGEVTGGLFERTLGYIDALSTEYHRGFFSLLLVGLLCLAGLATWRRLRPGGLVLLCFTLISIGLTVFQSTMRSRFLHSWLAVLWVVAAVGLINVLWREQAAFLRARRVLAVALLMLMTALNAPGLFSRATTREGGACLDRMSDLAIADVYLSSLEGSSRVAVLSNRPIKFYSWWTYAARYRKPRTFPTDANQLKLPTGESADFDAWAGKVSCDAIVLIRFHDAESPDNRDEKDVRLALEHQNVFRPVLRRTVPGTECEVVVYSRGRKETLTAR